MDFLKTLGIAASGLKAQSGRMRIIAENIANADSSAKTAGGEPYRRKIPTLTNRFDSELGATLVEAGRVKRDTTPFRTKYDPGNPAANAKGEVAMPNVNGLIENMDMREAQRSYEANLNMVTATRRMISKTLEILKALTPVATSAFAAGAYAAAQSIARPGASPKPMQATGAGGGFGQLLTQALDSVTQTGAKADAQTLSAATGKANVIDVVTAVAESETALQTLVAVRDRVISAYEEIMRMPI